MKTFMKELSRQGLSDTKHQLKYNSQTEGNFTSSRKINQSSKNSFKHSIRQPEISQF